MEMVRRWKTSDGKEHEDKGTAARHEAGLKAYAELVKLLGESVKTGRIEAVLRHLLVEAKAARAILAKVKEEPEAVKKAA
jgi:hypothetical protein